MLYLLETKLPENKSTLFALQFIYGIGLPRAKLICRKLGFAPNLKVKYLTQEQIVELMKIIDSLKWELNNELRRLESMRVKKLVEIKSYRGIRRVIGLPVRGQRTHTNAKSSRKNKIKNLKYEKSIYY